jgi:hypothetical protein
MNHMKISLSEEIALLAIEDDGRVSYTAGSESFALVLLAACVIDLIQLGRADADLQGIRLIKIDPIRLPHLDAVLDALKQGDGQTHSLIAELQNLWPLAHELTRDVLRSLVMRGVLTRQDQQFLWVLHTRRYPIYDDKEQKEAKLRILSTLLSDEIPSPHDTALIGLAHAGGLLQSFMSPSELARLSDRLKQTGGIDLVVQSAIQAIKEIQLARAKSMMFMH